MSDLKKNKNRRKRDYGFNGVLNTTGLDKFEKQKENKRLKAYLKGNDYFAHGYQAVGVKRHRRIWSTETGEQLNEIR